MLLQYVALPLTGEPRLEGGSGGHLPESPARIFTALSLKLISARFQSQIFSGLTARSTADLKEPSRPLGPPGPTSNPTYWVPALHHIPQRPSLHTSCSEVPHGWRIWEQEPLFWPEATVAIGSSVWPTRFSGSRRQLCLGGQQRWSTSQQESWLVQDVAFSSLKWEFYLQSRTWPL